MRLILDGPVNVYYVQTLCMIFFPGAKFGAAEQNDPAAPEMKLTLREVDGGMEANATVTVDGNSRNAFRHEDFSIWDTKEKTAKKACGAAIVSACGELLGYRPSWGMLTGVRPSKVATELLQAGVSKTRVKKILCSEYSVIPKKAALAVDVALAEQKIIGTPGKRDCSLYLSIPFCPTRCSYCSFVSYTSARLLSLIPDYLTHLAADVKATLQKIRELGLNLRTIYIGGGTPTILTADQLRQLLSVVAENIDVEKLEEYTLESGRADTITAEKFAVAKEYGVNRVCVNPQSLCDDVLREIGRSHTAEDFFRAFAVARESEIPFINTDLIVGLPGDSFRTFSKTFDRILALKPENITVHTFCVKKASDILRQDADVYSLRGGDAGKCVDYTQLQAQQEGYKPYYMYRQKNTVGNYENVGFALEGAECRYNIYMMEEVHSIFAAGAGAVSKLVDYRPERGGKPMIERLFYPKYPYEYLRDESTAAKLAQMEEFYRMHGLLE